MLRAEKRHNFKRMATIRIATGCSCMETQSHSPAPMAHRRVLIVEDEPLLAFEYQDEIESRGARAIVALTLEEGLSAVSAEPVDLAILDINLGEELSWPIARRLTAERVPFFIVSARCTLGELPGGVRPIACIDKPVVAYRLVLRVEELLAA